MSRKRCEAFSREKASRSSWAPNRRASMASPGDEVAVTCAKTANGERKIEGSDLWLLSGESRTPPNRARKSRRRTGCAGLHPRQRAAGDHRAGVWAIGECAGSPQFTHVSVDDFRIVRDNMAGGNRRTDDRQVPYVMFTDPPFARVGLPKARRSVRASRCASPGCR